MERVLDFSGDLQLTFHLPRHFPARIVKGAQKLSHINSFHPCIGLEARVLSRQFNRELSARVSPIRFRFHVREENLSRLQPDIGAQIFRLDRSKPQQRRFQCSLPIECRGSRIGDSVRIDVFQFAGDFVRLEKDGSCRVGAQKI